MADKHDNNNKGRKDKSSKIVRNILLAAVLAAFIAAGAGAGVVMAFIKEAPEVDTDNFLEGIALTTKVYDKDGNYVESLHGVENREYVSISKMNKYTRNAFIAIEDERFNDHPGVDVKRILGALWANIKAGRSEQGGSTITQQLVKNTLLTPKKELKRKIQEAYLSIKIERELSKDQILEYYLNTIYLGGPAYGVQAASEYYFDKNIDELTIAESALIAGLTQSPARYNPYLNTDKPDVYKNRQLTVLSKMHEHGMITNEELENAKTEELNFKKRDDSSTLKYQWFIESALDSIYDDLKEKYNYASDEIYQKIYSGGLKIYTTLDPKVQEAVEKAANDPKYYPTLSKDVAVWGKDNTIQPQIGIVINDYKTGEIRAVVGGRGKHALRSQNRAADPIFARQPGSAMKPIAVYAPAFDMGYSPASVIDDSPFLPEELAQVSGWPKEGPSNYDNKYRGLTTVRDAVKSSLNVVAARLILKIGPDVSTEYIKKFGISTLVLTGDTNDKGAAKALGGLTKGVTPLEMSAAYGVFGNGGTYTKPILYTKVLDSDGNVLLDKKTEKHQVISSQAAYLTVDVLKDVVTGGTGTAVRSKAKFTSMPSAGKTGTTENHTDAYFAGLTPYYSGAIWMGHDKPNLSLKLTSAETAWMWGDIMKEIHQGLTVKDFSKPGGITSLTVCRDSGKLPTDLCEKDPRGSRLITDMFITGKVPQEKCDVHVSVPVNLLTGKQAGPLIPPIFIKEYVFIKRPYPVDSRVLDYKYQVPGENDQIIEPISNIIDIGIPDSDSSEKPEEDSKPDDNLDSNLNTGRRPKANKKPKRN